MAWVGIIFLICMVVGFVTFVISFAFTEPNHQMKSVCTDAIIQRIGASNFTGYKVNEYFETPAGSIDVRGSYSGGVFACAITREPLLLEQILVNDNDITQLPLNYSK